MTANDILQSALSLMGDERHNELGYDSEGFRVRGLEFVNRIAEDLCITDDVSDLNAEINLPSSAKSAAAYGVAMLLSLSEGDTVRNEAFGNIYNGLRAAIKGNIGAVRDTLPKSGVVV